MKRGHFLLIFTFFALAFAAAAYPQEPHPKGWWKFDDAADLLKAEAGLGQALELVGSQEAVAGPAVGNGAVKIGVGSHYKMTHGIAANGGGNYVNEYSLLIDFKVPALSVWHCFFQTNPANSDDGDCFINPSGNIGVAATGYSSYALKANEWYRLVLSVKNGSHYRYYLDGQLLLDGNIQSVDGRFALDSLLLVFADEDREDNEIHCAELAIWDYPLTAQQVKDLGGYGHQTGPQILTLVPYLQTPTPNSIWICWHDTAATITQVEYGTTLALGQTTVGSSELISAPYRWHSVHLTDLQPNTEYYYKAISGSGASAVYSFKTPPDKTYQGKMRFLVLGDTRTDTTMHAKVIREAKKKIVQLYGSDIHNQLMLIVNTGDIVGWGGNIAQYTNEFFYPMSPLSPYVPTVVAIGNHEAEHAFYYGYMKYDDISALAPPSNYAEKFWWFTIANSMFIGLNANIVSSAGNLQKAWLETKLQEAEKDSTLDFVFCFVHHPHRTELWVDALTFDAGPNYVNNQLLPVFKKYSKVKMLSYGHTHAYERGAVESNQNYGDFHTVLTGGGGSELDRWGVYTNIDYSHIHTSYDYYHYIIVEVDIAQHAFDAVMYSLGNPDRPQDNVIMDQWHFRLNQPQPDQPVVRTPTVQQDVVIFRSSAFSGMDSLMTSRIQIGVDSTFTSTLIDTMVNWRNVYGVDAAFNPIDKNEGLDLTVFSFRKSRFVSGQVYYYRMSYRDHNLKWSDWSEEEPFQVETENVARNIVVLGSSTAAGVGPTSPDSAWVRRYSRYIANLDNNAKVINLAVGGYTTYDIMPTGYTPPAGRPTPKPNNNITYALTLNPNAIIINLPSNDATKGYSIAEQLANYDTVLAQVRSQNVPVWIATTQPRNLSSDGRQNLMAMRDSTFARFGSKAIDFWNGLANPDGTIQSQYNSGDGIHLNNSAHRLLFQRVVGAGIWQVITDVEEAIVKFPRDFVLSQNFPNPFNPSTIIAYQTPRSGHVSIKVYNALGQEVATLVDEEKPAGSYQVEFNAANLSSGIYFYKMRSGEFTENKKCNFVK